MADDCDGGLMKIAILVREETADKCIGKGCLNAFNKRLDAFSKYGEEAELIAFNHIGGDLDHKIKRLKENGVDVVHLSTCMRSKSDQYDSLTIRLSNYFKVVGYTHGTEIGKTKLTYVTLNKA